MSGSEPRTVDSVLRAAAAQRPDATAVVCEGSEISNWELLAAAEHRQGQLRAIGVGRGDRLLIMLGNSLDFVYTFLGASIGGSVEIPVNGDFRGQMLSYLIEDSGAETMVTEPELLERVLVAIGEESPLRRVVVVGESLPPFEAPAGVEVGLLAEVEPFEAAPVPVAERDPIGILYTSGTTGPAKGTLIAHRHAFEYATACVEMLELDADDVYYAPLPLFHIAGQWAVLYAGLISGATVAIRRRFSVNEFWADCNRHGVTVTFLLGAMAQFLQGQPERDDDAGHTLERVLMVPLVQSLDEFRARFGVRVTTCYGSTETGVPLVAGFDVDSTTVAGEPRPGYELRILDEDDEEVAVGELCVRHAEPWVTMVEYHGKPEATARAFRNQWLHSGDAMRRDEQGRYHFVDRIGDTLRRRGENISSFEVEREVYAHGAVLECAAIGIPSPHTEEDLVVVVVPKPGMTIDPEELREFLGERAPRFMVPDLVEVREEMPKTATGKIQKSVLREVAIAARR